MLIFVVKKGQMGIKSNRHCPYIELSQSSIKNQKSEEKARQALVSPDLSVLLFD